MAHGDALHELEALELAAELDAGATTSLDVVDALLARIEALDAPGSDVALRSILAVATDARDQAVRLDAERRGGATRSALHGVPVVIKDNIEAAGLPGSAGSLSLFGRPVTDAPLVARLRDAGLVVLAATNLSEWANLRSTRSTSGWSAVGGLTSNPYRLDRSAGGSSSGSGAALAARLAPLAIGTETDGSITCPASLNGVAGIKPAVGTVSARQVVPISASQDSPGPMARSVADTAALLDVLCGSNTLERVRAGARGVRVAVARNVLTGEPGTDAAFESAAGLLARAGCALHDVTCPEVPGEVGPDEMTVMLSEIYDDLGAYLAGRGGDGPRTLEEVVALEDAHAEVELAHFGHEYLVQAIERGGRANPSYAEARGRNLRWATEGWLEPSLRDADVLVAPCYGPAIKIDLVNGDSWRSVSEITTAPSIAGWPIATVPMGLVAGLPVGLAVLGRPGAEGTVLAVAAAVEHEAGLLAGGALVPGFEGPRRG